MRWCPSVALTVLLFASPAGAQPPADPAIAAAWEALKQGDAETADTRFTQALQRNPKDPALLFGAGAAAHLLGHEREAAERLRRALDLNPKLTEASAVLGEVEYLEGDLEAAIRTYETALKTATGEQPVLHERLEKWRKETAVNTGLTDRREARFSVVFDGQSESMLAEHAVAVLERAYSRISERLGAYPSNRILVTLYSEQQFRDVTRMPAWANGAFDGKIRVPIHGWSRDVEQFDRVLVHELTHAMVFQLAPHGVPIWLQEGLAGYFEARDPEAAQRRVQSMKTVLPFSTLRESFNRLDATSAAIAYEESLVAADVLMRMLGPRMGVLLQSLGRGQSFEDSLGQLGTQASEFEAQVLRRLQP